MNQLARRIPAPNGPGILTVAEIVAFMVHDPLIRAAGGMMVTAGALMIPWVFSMVVHTAMSMGLVVFQAIVMNPVIQTVFILAVATYFVDHFAPTFFKGILKDFTDGIAHARMTRENKAVQPYQSDGKKPQSPGEGMRWDGVEYVNKSTSFSIGWAIGELEYQAAEAHQTLVDTQQRFNQAVQSLDRWIIGTSVFGIAITGALVYYLATKRANQTVAEWDIEQHENVVKIARVAQEESEEDEGMEIEEERVRGELNERLQGRMKTIAEIDAEFNNYFQE